jgi:hypothetical protein
VKYLPLTPAASDACVGHYLRGVVSSGDDSHFFGRFVPGTPPLMNRTRYSAARYSAANSYQAARYPSGANPSRVPLNFIEPYLVLRRCPPAD